MKKLFAYLFLLCSAIVLHGQNATPALLLGYKWDTRELNTAILFPARVATDIKLNWVSPAEYAKYSAVYIGERIRLGKDAHWNSKESLKTVTDYLFYIIAK